MQSARLFKRPDANSFALILIGFFMTSLGYLAWLYRLMELVSVGTADLLTMVWGYLFQAAGVGLFALVRARAPKLVKAPAFVVVLAAYALLCAGATLSTSLAAVLATGFAMNLLCGIIAGLYLDQLASHASENRRALVFGGGYCAATVAQWLIGFVGSGTLQHAPDALVVHTVLALAFAYLVIWERPAVAEHRDAAPLPDNLLPLACTTALLLSVIKNLGFSFPSADVAAGVDLELSRLFYAAGLVLAGIITDRHRQHGAICCLAACVTPFIMLALGDGSVSATVLWGLDYFFYGFFTVFRVILFADIAARTGRPWLAGLGLLLGRMGDAMGTGINALLGTRSVVLIALAALLFMLAVFLFFRLSQSLYAPEAASPQRTEQERFEHFCAAHELSVREREVLRMLLAEKSNAEIAAEMFVSESTVKFHVHNLLGKTGCSRRTELLAAFGAFEG